MAKSGNTGTSRNETEQGLRIALKLRERTEEWPRGLDKMAGLGKQGGTIRLLPLVQSLKPERLCELMEKARAMDPEAKLQDFFTWYQFSPPAGLDPDRMARLLRKSEMVESAYVMRPVRPPVTASNDPRSKRQRYLNAAGTGINARYAWGFPGGDGSGIGFVDMERGWNLNHEDLAAAGITLISGISHDCLQHGTSVLGEVLMVDNNIGGIGIAPGAKGRVVSQWRKSGNFDENDPQSFNNVDAIWSAISSMVFGDVLLLEAQDLAPLGATAPDATGAATQAMSYWPIEVAYGAYGVIQHATALGIVVVEAAGNGKNDLDTYKNEYGKKIFDPNSADFRDSGAIMAGAGTKASPHKPVNTTNHGKRVDCYAWGEKVDTATINNQGKDDYRKDFDGTSSASAIIAGAALVVQGLAQAKLGQRYSPKVLRQILNTTGTPSKHPGVDRIGVMPDIQAIATANGLAP
jgi:hypothetical protein